MCEVRRTAPPTSFTAVFLRPQSLTLRALTKPFGTRLEYSQTVPTVAKWNLWAYNLALTMHTPQIHRANFRSRLHKVCKYAPIEMAQLRAQI